ncbi:MAG: hypothetical protein CMM66_00785 [Rhodospirillaceae bacterium]|nr:hypothetical protein [Rhodospirillaceae bacterium]
MQIIITILIIAGLVMFFGPESCSDLGDTTSKSEAASEESYSRSSESGSDEDDPFSEVRQLLPDISGPASESEIVKRAQASSFVAEGVCPNPFEDVREREQAWLKQEAQKGDNYLGPRFTEDNDVYFGSGTPSFLKLEVTSTPSRDAVIARDMLFATAILQAKAGIITQINNNMTVERYLKQPRTGMTNEEAIYKKGEDLRNNRKEIAGEIEAVNEELGRVNEALLDADEDYMEGVTFGDRIGSSIDGINKRLNEEYNRSDITAEEKEQLDMLRARVQTLKNKKETLEIEQEKLADEILPYAKAVSQEEAVNKLAWQTLYGVQIVKQFFCFNPENRAAALLIRAVWSTKLQEEAEKTLRREPVKLQPTDPPKQFFQYLLSDLDVQRPTFGRYVEPNGSVVWYAVRHGIPILGNSVASTETVKAFAEAMLLTSLYSEVGTQVQASRGLVGAADGRGAFTTETLAVNMREEAKNVFFPVTSHPGITDNPMGGKKLEYAVAYVSADSLARSPEMVKLIEEANFRFHKDQAYVKGLISGMQAAGASTKNDPEASRRGFNEGASGVISGAQENSSISNQKRTGQPKPEKADRWESDVNDDF